MVSTTRSGPVCELSCDSLLYLCALLEQGTHVYCMINLNYTICICFLAIGIVSLWRTELAKTNEKAAESIANPEEYENLFPELSQTLQVEKVRKLFDLLEVLCSFLLQMLTQERAVLKPASLYPTTTVSVFATGHPVHNFG